MSHKVSLVIPTYRERDNIVPLVERIHKAMSGYSYEVVLVDDNSRDGTVEAVASLAQKYPVRIVVREKERGLATAVVAGLRQVTDGTVVVMDADLQHPPEAIPDLVEAIDRGADIAIASRYVPGGGCQGWGFIRRMISKVAIAIAHVFLPSTRQVTDPVSGFFAVRRRSVDPDGLKPTGYKILLEVLIEAGAGRVTAEVPYVFKMRSRGESKLTARQQIDYLKHIYSLMRRKGELTRFVRFCLVGSSGIVVNEGLLWALVELAAFPRLVAAAISIEAAIISNFTLNDRFTFADRRRSAGNPFPVRLGKFNLVSLVALGVNLATFALLTEVAGMYYLLSNLVGIAVAFLINYLVNTSWTWR